jgi:hypothetical protein
MYKLQIASLFFGLILDSTTEGILPCLKGFWRLQSAIAGPTMPPESTTEQLYRRPPYT